MLMRIIIIIIQYLYFYCSWTLVVGIKENKDSAYQENKGIMEEKWAISVVMGVMQILSMSASNYEIIIYFRNVNVCIQGSKGQFSS